jgi:small GTP-binding protein
MKKITIGILAHVDAGKTTLSEAILYKTGAIRKLGRVDARDTFLDTNKIERERGITVFSKQAVFSTKNTDFTLIDTPGHTDFSTEMERSLQVLDYAILVISANEGIQGHTETLWRLLARYKIPTFIFVNKMDQPGASKDIVLTKLQNRFSDMIMDFNNINPEDVVLCDEELCNDYLENGNLDFDRLSLPIKERKLFPCCFGSALLLKGIDDFIEILDRYTKETQYPKAFGARVYKIARDSQGMRLTFMKITGGSLKTRQLLGETEKINQIRIYSGDKFTAKDEVFAGEVCAITGIESSQAGMSYGVDRTSEIPMLSPVLMYKLSFNDKTKPNEALPSLRILEEEDPSLHIVWNDELSEIQLQIMGAVQVEVLQKMIRERFGWDVTFGNGNIVYKETICDKVEGVGHFEPLRHYAEVHLILEPGEPGSGMVFEADCSEDLLAKNWQRLIMTHLQEKTFRGVLTGAPITDIKITLVAGKAHPKHTEGGDFRQATYRAVRQGLMQAKSKLLEPYFSFLLEIPQEYVGRAMTDLERMGAEFELKANEAISIIEGLVPVSTSNDYQLEVNAYSKGKGHFNVRMGGYGPCHNAEEVCTIKGYEADRDLRNPSSSVFCTHGSGFTVEWFDVFKYMHIPLSISDSSVSSYEYENRFSTSTKDVMDSSSDISIGTEEIDSIINKTYYNNAGNSGMWKGRLGKKVLDNDFSNKTFNAKPKPAVDEIPYLLVDGYNNIFAWKELDELSKINLDSARGKLLDILCNYQGITGINIIVVFDAYRVSGHDTEYLDYHNIHVVYTKEAETADAYIERFAHENGRKYDVRVATSDGLEQVIILGQGCRLVSSREFELEVKNTIDNFNQDFAGKIY